MFLPFTCLFYIFCLAGQEGQSHSPSLQDNILEPLRSLHLQRELGTAYSLRKPLLPDEDICCIVAGKSETLHNCNFKSTAKTFLVIHGWTVSGLFESWVAKLVAALYDRKQDANVVVVDWLDIAQNRYSVAAHKTQEVGQEETATVPLKKIHLIGYNLGAHIAGNAGSSVTKKVGRITGLDPAGLVTEEDIDELLMLKLKVENLPSLFSMMWPWWNRHSPELHVHEISIWIREMQKKYAGSLL